jgi:class 3 adenylate cyclase
MHGSLWRHLLGDFSATRTPLEWPAIEGGAGLFQPIHRYLPGADPMRAQRYLESDDCPRPGMRGITIAPRRNYDLHARGSSSAPAATFIDAIRTHPIVIDKPSERRRVNGRHLREDRHRNRCCFRHRPGHCGRARRGGCELDEFTGDSVMALFGLDTNGPDACRQALAAARRMSTRLVALDEELAPDLRAPLAMGVGVHFGPAIVGDMGDGRWRSLTAVGDTVNTASRLEALCKVYHSELVVSDDLLACAGAEFQHARPQEIEIRKRGRSRGGWRYRPGSVPRPFAAFRPRQRI